MPEGQTQTCGTDGMWSPAQPICQCKSGMDSRIVSISYVFFVVRLVKVFELQKLSRLSSSKAFLCIHAMKFYLYYFDYNDTSCDSFTPLEYR